MTRFTRQPNGGWRFETRSGRTFEAWRNEAGFADRQWELHEISWYPVADGQYHEMREIVSDMFTTRASAVAFAEEYSR